MQQADKKGNIHFFYRAPQLLLLEHANVFLTHGGLSSTKEAISCCVPLLVYPLDKTWDQPGNALKIEYHKLGLRGDFKTDGLKEIKEKINQLLTNNIYKINLSDFNKKCCVKNDFFNELINLI